MTAGTRIASAFMRARRPSAGSRETAQLTPRDPTLAGWDDIPEAENARSNAG